MKTIIEKLIESKMIPTIKMESFLSDDKQSVRNIESYNQIDNIYFLEKIVGKECILCYSSNSSGEIDDYCIFLDKTLAVTSEKIKTKNNTEVLKDIRKIAEETIRPQGVPSISYKSIHKVFAFAPNKQVNIPDSLFIFFGTVFGKDCPESERYSTSGQAYNFNIFACSILNKANFEKQIKVNMIITSNFCTPSQLSTLSRILCLPLTPIRNIFYGKELIHKTDIENTYVKPYQTSQAGLEYNSNGQAAGLYILNEALLTLEYIDFENSPTIPKKIKK